jgi:hypothetical protein
MGIWEKLLKTEQNIRKRVENAFGSETTRTPLEVRREILEQVESRIAIDSGGNQFPYGKILVRLQPPAGALQDVFETAFLQENSLKTDILQMLKDSDARHTEALEVIVELKRNTALNPEASSPGPLFQIDFVKPDPSIKREVPETSFVISKGSAEQPTYKFMKERILIGRLEEVLDREGRMVRRNDVIFLDNGDDINSTVGRAHARIWYDFEKGEFFIMDEISRFGTIVVREGRSIEVPAGNPRGIRLRSSDAIYCGQACLRFLIRGQAT